MRSIRKSIGRKRIGMRSRQRRGRKRSRRDGRSARRSRRILEGKK